MRRLTAADAMFLYNELPSQHMHTLKLAIFDHSKAPGGYSFESQKRKLAARLDLLPPLRWRTVNTPLAALTLLNDPTFVEAARAFGARIISEGGETDEQRFQFAFGHAVSRSPDDVEDGILKKLLATQRAHYQQHPEEAKKLVAIGLAPMPSDDLDTAELAAWTAVARVILNMNEAISRN